MEWLFYSFWPWLALIAVVGIISATIGNAVDKSNKTKRYVADAANGGNYKKLAEESAGVNAKLLTRLDAVESRLAVIEKTLTDIP